MTKTCLLTYDPRYHQHQQELEALLFPEIPWHHSSPINRKKVASDGATYNPTNPRFRLANWSLVCADTHQTIAATPLPGIVRSSSRAELYGTYSGLTCAQYVTCITDSAYVYKGVRAIQAGRLPFKQGVLPSENTPAAWAHVTN